LHVQKTVWLRLYRFSFCLFCLVGGRTACLVSSAALCAEDVIAAAKKADAVFL
jgi:hypothetical protein